MEGFWPKLARQASNVVRSITYKHQKRAHLVKEFILFRVGSVSGLAIREWATNRICAVTTTL